MTLAQLGGGLAARLLSLGLGRLLLAAARLGAAALVALARLPLGLLLGRLLPAAARLGVAALAALARLPLGLLLRRLLLGAAGETLGLLLFGRFLLLAFPSFAG